MQNHQAPSLAQYTEWLAESGARAFLGSERMAWSGYIKGVVSRLPIHSTEPPTRSELQAAFRHRCVVANYLIEPDARHPANRLLYIADKTYDFENLSEACQRNTRRARRLLRFTDPTWDEVRQYGEAAYCQTNVRLGLRDTTQEAFQGYIDRFSRIPAHHAVGAWAEDRLIAFVTLVRVDDWVDIKGIFSTDADRTPYRPSEGLYHYMVERFIFNESYRLISNGVAGRSDGLNPGLHQFKVKAGFRAIPVHRTNSLPIWIQPLLNPVMLLSAKAALRLYPKSVALRRGVKTLDDILHPQPLPTDQENGFDRI